MVKTRLPGRSSAQGLETLRSGIRPTSPASEKIGYEEKLKGQPKGAASRLSHLQMDLGLG
jgi:hypothetical protein